MLRRFEWIRDGGIFADYRWDSTLPDLARINVVYGPNGSGKTSLARVLDGTRNETDGFHRLSVQVEDAGTRRGTNGRDDVHFDRLHVFSEQYVGRSHRFAGGSPNIDAVLTLGERTAEAEAKIESLRAELVTKTSEFNTAQASVTAAERATTAALERVSAAVVGDLSRVDGYRNRSSYNSGAVGKKYEGDRSAWKTLPDDELASKKQFVASDNREEVDRNSFSLAPDTDLQERATALLATTPVTIVLDTLKAHPEASSWVQEGQELHTNVVVCLFCGQSIPEGRLHDIEQHFSDEVARLQRELRALDTELEARDSDADALVRRLPTRVLLFDDLRSTFETATTTLNDQVIALKEWIVELRERARTKASNVLATVDAIVTSMPVVDGAALEAVCRAHNDRVAQHAQLLAATAKEIEGHHLKAEEPEIDRQAAARVAAEGQRGAAQTRIDAINDEIATLENVEGDPIPSADVLTREVARLLGRSELSFRAREGHYVVTRDGEPAVGLSVGERSAITLVHFLETVARSDASAGKPIVVIDDPVSSLDSNMFMGISTYIWTEAVAKEHVDQLILLTHNFDLFRQWDVQVESMHKNRGLKRSHPAEFYELRSHHVTSHGRTRRRPVIVRWPETTAVRKKIRSTYHHAFIEVADAKKRLTANDSLEYRLDAQLLFPNVIRRILESFLAFKRPEWVGDFTDAMRRSGELLIDQGYEGDADALRQKLTRYSHAYSHTQTPETDEIVNPDEISGAISSVFMFMNQIDGDHFKGLCAVAGIDPAALLPEAPTLGDEVA